MVVHSCLNLSSYIIDWENSKLPKKFFIDHDNEVYIVGTYPNTSTIEKLTIKCLNTLKNTNRKIITTSHHPVSKEIQELSDYVIYDKNNILTNHTFNWWFFSENDEYKIYILKINSDNVKIETQKKFFEQIEAKNTLNKKIIFINPTETVSSDFLLDTNLPRTLGRCFATSCLHIYETFFFHTLFDFFTRYRSSFYCLVS